MHHDSQWSIGRTTRHASFFSSNNNELSIFIATAFMRPKEFVISKRIRKKEPGAVLTIRRSCVLFVFEIPEFSAVQPLWNFCSLLWEYEVLGCFLFLAENRNTNWECNGELISVRLLVFSRESKWTALHGIWQDVWYYWTQYSSAFSGILKESGRYLYSVYCMLVYLQ